MEHWTASAQDADDEQCSSWEPWILSVVCASCSAALKQTLPLQETQAAYSNGGLLSMWSRPALVHAASSALPAAQPLLSGGGAANWAAVDAARRPSQPNGKVRAGRALLSGMHFIAQHQQQVP